MPPSRVRTGTVATLALENRHAQTEQLLTQYGVSWEFLGGVHVNQIDVEKSRSNQARFKVLHEDTVAAYVAKLESGATFPPIVAYRANRGKAKKLSVIDGNHRTEAHRRAELGLDIYELDPMTPPQTIQILTFELNTQNGLNYTPAEALSHAADVVEIHNVKVRVAAQKYGVTYSQLTQALAARKADRRAIEAGIDSRVWESLPSTTKMRLIVITTDEILKIAASLVAESQMGALETQQMATKLNDTRSIEKQKTILKQMRVALAEKIQEYKTGKKSRGAHTPKHRIALGLSQFTGLPSNVGAISRLYAGDERSDMADQLEPIVTILTELMETLRSE